MKDIKEQISELREELNRRIDRLEKELKPEFKVGQWIAYEDPNAPVPIRRIKTLNGTWGKDDNDGVISLPEGYRPATPQEIEAHLRSICDKYVGENVTDLVAPKEKVSITDIPHQTGSYVEKYDQYWMTVINGDGACVYEKGRFATILPSLKPKPETREDFNKFLGDFTNRHCHTVDDFLQNYDIK